MIVQIIKTKLKIIQYKNKYNIKLGNFYICKKQIKNAQTSNLHKHVRI